MLPQEQAVPATCLFGSASVRMTGRLFTCRHHLNEGQQAAQLGRHQRSGNPWKRRCAQQQRATVASATLMRDAEQDASQWMTPQDPMPQQVSKRAVCCRADQLGLTCGGRLRAGNPCQLCLAQTGNGRAAVLPAGHLVLQMRW